MTIYSAADLKAEYDRLSYNWKGLSRHRKGITLARLEELEERLLDLGGQDGLIARVKYLRQQIKFALSVEEPATTGRHRAE
jgi:hypothetical protein